MTKLTRTLFVTNQLQACAHNLDKNIPHNFFNMPEEDVNCSSEGFLANVLTKDSKLNKVYYTLMQPNNKKLNFGIENNATNKN